MKRVFISYAHEDGDFADNVRHKLEEAGIATWQDTSLYGGQQWRAEIDLAIRDALAFVLIVSPEAVTSSYVSYEWAFALGVGINVIPILLRGTPAALHPALQGRHYLDFSVRTGRPWDSLVKAVKGSVSSATQSTIRVSPNAPLVLDQAVRALDSLDEKQRAGALDTLGNMIHPAVAEVLAEAVKHPVEDVRLRAGELLVNRGDKRGLQAIFEALRHERSVKHVQFVKLGSDACPELIQALQDKFSAVRRTAARALGDIAEPSAIPALKNLLEDKDLRESVLNALKCFHDPALLPVFQEALDSAPHQALAAAAAIPDNAGESVLIEGLQHHDREVRLRAAAFLAESATPAALPALCKAAKDSYDQVRHQAIEALGNSADPQVAPIILDALEDEELIVQSRASDALRKIPRPVASRGLLDILRNPDKVFRDGAARLLGEIGDESAIPGLVDALGQLDTRSEAVQALGKLAKPGSPAVPAIVALLPDSGIRSQAAAALEEIADPATIDALAQLLDDPEDAVRYSAQSALRRIGTPEAQRTLAAKLRERRVRRTGTQGV